MGAPVCRGVPVGRIECVNSSRPCLEAAAAWPPSAGPLEGSPPGSPQERAARCVPAAAQRRGSLLPVGRADLGQVHHALAVAPAWRTYSASKPTFSSLKQPHWDL